MAKTTERDRRAAGRKERRAAAVDEPTIERATEAVEGDPADALRAAASAAIAAAAVGAAKALARRRNGGDDVEGDDEVQDEGAVAEPERADDHAEEPDAEPEEGPREQEDSRPRGPVHAGDAQRIVQHAREQLSELNGADAESVSAVRRTADGWRVGLEVVEVHRVPESTDVLATYEVELDDDGELITFERVGRYYRSEADRR